MHDVIVVGGSVAGAACAAFLAREGRDVLLLDRARFPRAKACGEGIQPYGVEVLDRLGVSLPGAMSTRGLRFRVGPRSRDVAFPGREGLAVRRLELDPALRTRALDAGATLLRQTVTSAEPGCVRTREETHRARMVIGADGVGSVCHGGFGVRRTVTGGRLGLSTHVQGWRGPSDRVEVILLTGGELYLAPVGPRETLVAFLLEPKLWKEHHGAPPRTGEDVARFLRRHWPERASALRVEEPVLSSAPLSTRVDRVCGPGWLLVGDAAGRLDPVSGQGLALALAGAELAAGRVGEMLEGGVQETDYARAWLALRRPAAAVTSLLLALSRHPRWAAEALRLPFVADRLMARAARGGAGEWTGTRRGGRVRAEPKVFVR